MPGLAQCLLKPSLSRKFLQYSSGLQRGEISTFCILAHHSAIFLCFWNVEIDDSLVGQLTICMPLYIKPLVFLSSSLSHLFISHLARVDNHIWRGIFSIVLYGVEILRQIISVLFLMGAVPGQTNRRWRHKFAHTIFRHNVNYHRHDH